MGHTPLHNFINAANIKNAIFHFRTFGFRSMVRKTREYLEFTRNYNLWLKTHRLTKDMLLTQKQHLFSYCPTISIIVPVYKTPDSFLRQMIESVISQTYSNWELCIADGSADSSASYIGEIVKKYQLDYPNIHYTLLEKNLGISGNTNSALSLASGEYIALLDHDDILTPDALYEIVSEINKNPSIDILYTDEDKTNINYNSFYDPYFKPHFNLDLLRSCNYITHFYVVKKSLADEVGGFDNECDGSQDYDFILKTCERAKVICHIPKILYHWRIHPASVAGDPESKAYAYNSAVRALQNHLNRCHENGIASRDAQFGYYRIKYACTDSPLISIIMIDCNPQLQENPACISTYPNIEFVSSPDLATGEYLTFLYRVKEILAPDWLEQFLGNCSRSSVGLVGAKSYYKKGRVLDAGLVFTPDGQIHSPFYKYYDCDPGYCYRARIQQSCSFIGPHCFMIKAETYRQFIDSSLNIHFTESFFKLCHTLTQNKRSIVLLPYVSVISSDRNRTLPILEYCKGRRDPYYNPNFSDQHMYRLS